VREASETARTVVLDTLRARGAASNRAAQCLIRLETADQIFGALIALSDLREPGTARHRAAVAPILRRLRVPAEFSGGASVPYHRPDRSGRPGVFINR